MFSLCVRIVGVQVHIYTFTLNKALLNYTTLRSFNIIVLVNFSAPVVVHVFIPDPNFDVSFVSKKVKQSINKNYNEKILLY